MKLENGVVQIIYDENMYFPIRHQKGVLNSIQEITIKYLQHEDQEKLINESINLWQLALGLTPYKPMFPKENLGVLIGDPFFNFY